jgi:hypothetical protein
MINACSGSSRAGCSEARDLAASPFWAPRSLGLARSNHCECACAQLCRQSWSRAHIELSPQRPPTPTHTTPTQSCPPSPPAQPSALPPAFALPPLPAAGPATLPLTLAAPRGRPARTLSRPERRRTPSSMYAPSFCHGTMGTWRLIESRRCLGPS